MTAGIRHGRPVGLVGVLRGLSGRALWAFDGMHGLSVLRRRRRCKHGARTAKYCQTL